MDLPQYCVLVGVLVCILVIVGGLSLGRGGPAEEIRRLRGALVAEILRTQERERAELARVRGAAETLVTWMESSAGELAELRAAVLRAEVTRIDIAPPASSASAQVPEAWAALTALAERIDKRLGVVSGQLRALPDEIVKRENGGGPRSQRAPALSGPLPPSLPPLRRPPPVPVPPPAAPPAPSAARQSARPAPLPLPLPGSAEDEDQDLTRPLELPDLRRAS